MPTETHQRLLESARRAELTPQAIADRFVKDSTTCTIAIAQQMTAEFFEGRYCATGVAEAVIKLTVEKDARTLGVRPPPGVAHIEQHHLSNGGTGTFIALWKRDQWWLHEAGPISPEQLAAEGWRYVEPVPAPSNETAKSDAQPVVTIDVKVPPAPPFVSALELFSLGNGLAVCSNPGHRFHGWLFRQHPDGQWVSVVRLSLVDLPPDPLTSGRSAIASPTVVRAHHVERAVAEAIEQFMGEDAFAQTPEEGETRENVAKLARQLIDIVVGVDLATSMPDPKATAWDSAAETRLAAQRMEQCEKCGSSKSVAPWCAMPACPHRIRPPRIPRSPT